MEIALDIKAEYIDHMGDDLAVVNAAKVSFSKESKWETIENASKTIKFLSEKDQRLIQFLARGVSNTEWKTLIETLSKEHDFEPTEDIINNVIHIATHWVPFTHTAIKLRVKAPVPIRTQCFKHKVGFTESEESRRYISSTPELYIPKHFHSAPDNKKQGSGAIHSQSEDWIYLYTRECEKAIKLYEDMIAAGIAPEEARFVLPQGVHVNWIWTGNLASFARYYNQRSDQHAQNASNELAEMIGNIIEPLFPVSWKALTR